MSQQVVKSHIQETFLLLRSQCELIKLWLLFSRSRYVHHLLGIVFTAECMKGGREEGKKREGQKEEKKEGRERGKEGGREGGAGNFSRQAYSQPPLAERLVNPSSFNPSFFQTLSPWADLCPFLLFQLCSLFMTLTSPIFKVKVATSLSPQRFQ